MANIVHTVEMTPCESIAWDHLKSWANYHAQCLDLHKATEPGKMTKIDSLEVMMFLLRREQTLAKLIEAMAALAVEE